MPPLIAKTDDFLDPQFNKEIGVADLVLAMSRYSQDLEFVWGMDIPERLVGGELKSPKMVYIGVAFNDADELENVIRAVRRIKEGGGDDEGPPRLSMDSESRKPN